MWEWYQPPFLGGGPAFTTRVPVTATQAAYIETLATYSNLRQFTVETIEQVK